MNSFVVKTLYTSKKVLSSICCASKMIPSWIMVSPACLSIARFCCFLQSTIAVIVFPLTLIPSRCHLKGWKIKSYFHIHTKPTKILSSIKSSTYSASPSCAPNLIFCLDFPPRIPRYPIRRRRAILTLRTSDPSEL